MKPKNKTWLGRRLLMPAVVGALVLPLPLPAAHSTRKETTVSTNAPTTFAPLPREHELASIWNDPDFARRLIGSYGFASEAEPRMTPEEQAGLLRHHIEEHLLPDELGKLAARANVKTVVLTHLNDDYVPFAEEVKKHFSGPVLIAKDLMEF